MNDERKGISKEQIIKETKENEDLVSFVKSLTKEEIQRIKDVREFEEIKPGTPTYKIALMCDQIRSQMRLIKSTIEKRLWSVDDLTNNINRLRIQLAKGEITEEVKQGLRMNEKELNTLIQHNIWLRDGEVNAIPMKLAEMRSLVGHKDVGLNIVMTQEEFDNYIEQVQQKLKEKGYDLFGELNKK